MTTFKLSDFIPYTILIVSILSVIPQTKLTLDIPESYIILFQVLTLLIYLIAPIYSINKQKIKYLNWLLAWNIISIIHGVFVAKIYWDWKGLFVNTLVLLLPVVAYTSINLNITRKVFLFYLKFTLPLFLYLMLVITYDAYGFYLAPISILLIFFPLLNNKLKLIILFLTLLVLTIDLGARSNVIKFAIPGLILSFYYFKLLRSRRIIELVRIVLIIGPIVLFILGVSGIFNVFRINDYIKADLKVKKENIKGKTEIDDLKSDTRTFLYLEVLHTAKKYKSWLFGRSPARGNETKWFASAMIKDTGRAERLSNEVAILNIFTWTGLIGVIFYFLVFYHASYLAINHSNNIFSQMLGVYIAFRWLYAWIEDMNVFSSTYLTLWIAIGLCYSETLRKMNDTQVKEWIRNF